MLASITTEQYPQFLAPQTDCQHRGHSSPDYGIRHSSFRQFDFRKNLPMIFLMVAAAVTPEATISRAAAAIYRQ